MGETGMHGSGGPDSDRNEGGDTPGPTGGERDYGDSAGYGGGGSTLDYDEVLGDETSRRDIGPNPLDAVVHTERDKDEAANAEAPANKEAGALETHRDR